MSFQCLGSNSIWQISRFTHRQALKTHEPVYQAIWANTTDFDEVLISPVMLQDHMPDTVLSALEKVSWQCPWPLISVFRFSLSPRLFADILSIIHFLCHCFRFCENVWSNRVFHYLCQRCSEEKEKIWKELKSFAWSFKMTDRDGSAFLIFREWRHEKWQIWINSALRNIIRKW